MKFGPFLVGYWKEILQFLFGWGWTWSRKQYSYLAQTFHGSSMWQNETPVKLFESRNLPFRQNKPIKCEILHHFWPFKINWSNFWGADLGSRFQISPKLCMILQCHKITLLWRSFCSDNLLFRQKEIKSVIWTLFTCLERIDKVLGCLFGKQHSVLAQSLHGASVSQNKTPVKIFGSSNLPFWQNKAIKYEI